MDTTPPGLETVSTTTSSRKRPLDRGDKAGALAGASGPDTGIPSAESPGDGALVGRAVSGASAGASRPDTEPPKEAPPSSVKTLGSLADCGKLSTPAPSLTLRTSLATSTPMDQRLQDQVTYSFADDGNILLTNVMAGLPCLPRKLDKPLRSLRWGRSWTYASSLTSPSSHLPTLHGLWKSTPSPRPRSWRKRSGRPNTCARAAAPWAIWRNFPSRKTRCLSCVANALPVGLSRRLPNAFTVELWARWSRRHYPRPLWQWMVSPESDAVDHGDQQKSAYSIEVSYRPMPSCCGGVTIWDLLQRVGQWLEPPHSSTGGPQPGWWWCVPKAPSGAQTPTSTRQRSGPRDSHLPSIQCEGNAPGVRASPSRTAWEKWAPCWCPDGGRLRTSNRCPVSWRLRGPRGCSAATLGCGEVQELPQEKVAGRQRATPGCPPLCKLELLRATSESISVWPTKVRKALESGLLEPERGPMAVDSGGWTSPGSEGGLPSDSRAHQHGHEPFQPTAAGRGAGLPSQREVHGVPRGTLHRCFMPWYGGVLSGGFYFHGPHHEGDRQWAGAWFRWGEVGHDPCDVGLPQRRGQGLWWPVDYCSWSPHAARLGFQEGGQPGGLGFGTPHTPLQHEDSMGWPDGVHGGRDPWPCGTEEASPPRQGCWSFLGAGHGWRCVALAPRCVHMDPSGPVGGAGLWVHLAGAVQYLVLHAAHRSDPGPRTEERGEEQPAAQDLLHPEGGDAEFPGSMRSPFEALNPGRVEASLPRNGGLHGRKQLYHPHSSMHHGAPTGCSPWLQTAHDWEGNLWRTNYPTTLCLEGCGRRLCQAPPTAGCCLHGGDQGGMALHRRAMVGGQGHRSGIRRHGLSPIQEDGECLTALAMAAHYGPRDEADGPMWHFAPFLLIDPDREPTGVVGTDFLTFLIDTTLQRMPQPTTDEDTAAVSLAFARLMDATAKGRHSLLYDARERRWAAEDRDNWLRTPMEPLPAIRELTKWKH